MKLKNLLSSLSDDIGEIDITGIEQDSRLVQPGTVFLAYPGSQVDGRLFINNAIQQGAAAVFYEPEDFSPASSTIPLIPIPHLSLHVGSIASQFYGEPGLAFDVTGITGTNGKTTIAYQLSEAHQALGCKTAYVGTLGEGCFNDLRPLNNTTPDALTLQRLFYAYKKQQIKNICMEVSSHALCQGRVEAIDFKQAIFTNLTHDHLDYHHTMAAYGQAKAMLFATSGLEWAILNEDDEAYSIMKNACGLKTKILSYGINTTSDVRVSSVKMSMVGTEIEVDTPWGQFNLHLKTIGRFNIYNAMAVFSSLLLSGYDPKRVVEVMAQLHPSPGRMEIVVNNPTVLVDYAHTPDALEKALLTLKGLKKRKLMVVFGCGGDRDKTKRAVMGRVASEHADEVIITSDNPRTEDPQQIMDEIQVGLIETSNVRLIPDRKAAIQAALESAHPDDLNLIAGKGHEDYQQIGTIKYPFSDQGVVKDFFSAVNL